MRRRDFVKGILAASAAAKTLSAQQAAPVAQAAHTLPAQTPTAPGPVPWMRGLMEVKPLPLGTLIPDAVAQTNAHFFDETQTATLGRLCALLMPPLKGYPGAIEVDAPVFLDFLIGVSPAPRQQLYQSGLDWLEEQSKARYFLSFAKTNDVQADALVRPWLRTWMGETLPTEPHADFINNAHSDIRTATVNSQAWREVQHATEHYDSALDLYWYPVDPNLHGELNATQCRPSATALRS